MGVMFTQRPDLFNAVVCAVPLLDMMRFHTLLAGASWMGEYGNPEDPVEGAFLRKISPYHNIDPEGDYPEVFFVTSTKDDRVHPAHARKTAKRMGNSLTLPLKSESYPASGIGISLHLIINQMRRRALHWPRFRAMVALK